jgi:hypothetical protein
LPTRQIFWPFALLRKQKPVDINSLSFHAPFPLILLSPVMSPCCCPVVVERYVFLCPRPQFSSVFCIIHTSLLNPFSLLIYLSLRKGILNPAVPFHCCLLVFPFLDRLFETYLHFLSPIPCLSICLHSYYHLVPNVSTLLKCHSVELSVLAGHHLIWPFGHV